MALKLGFGKTDRNSDHNATPKDLYNELDKEFKFKFDPCPLHGEENQDGLKIEWKECNFVNPPFSQVKKWLKKGIEELKNGKKSVFLITTRSNSRYWEKYVYPYASEIRFIRNQVKFGEYRNGFPTPVCIVLLDPSKKVNNLTKKYGIYKMNKWIRY
jgi:hypothetical protein